MANDEEVLIHTPAPDQAAAIQQLLQKLSQETATFSVAEGTQQLSTAQMAEQINDINHSRNNLLLVAQSGPELIAILTITPTPTPESAELGIAVQKAYWNLGLGSSLLDEALDWAEEDSQLKYLVLTVQERNAAAIHVYQNFGFQELPGETVTVTDTVGQQVTAIQMRYKI